MSDSLTALLTRIRALPLVQRIVFFEYLAGVLGYSKDYYTGWDTNPPQFAAEVFEATEEQLNEAWKDYEQYR